MPNPRQQEIRFTYVCWRKPGEDNSELIDFGRKNWDHHLGKESSKAFTTEGTV